MQEIQQQVQQQMQTQMQEQQLQQAEQDKEVYEEQQYEEQMGQEEEGSWSWGNDTKDASLDATGEPECRAGMQGVHPHGSFFLHRFCNHSESGRTSKPSRD